jgi:hypothetical protein
LKTGVCAHVGHPSKLLQQIPGEEGDNRVLGGDDLVRAIYVFLLDLSLVGLVVWREILMDDDGARRTWEFLPGKEVFDIEGG